MSLQNGERVLLAARVVRVNGSMVTVQLLDGQAVRLDAGGIAREGPTASKPVRLPRAKGADGENQLPQ